jgi:hypothetical protein
MALKTLERPDEALTPEPKRMLRRPPYTWRVLCDVDGRFPRPDEGFMAALAKDRIIVPVPKLEEAVQMIDGVKVTPGKTFYLPMHRPNGPLFDTIHGRSINTETPLADVGKVPEYTFKGAGWRLSSSMPNKGSYWHFQYEDMFERRWVGFALYPTIKTASNNAITLHAEYERAAREGDPIVANAVKHGFREAPTLRYGGVFVPLQSMVNVYDTDRFLEENRGLLLPEEAAKIRKRGKGVYPIRNGIEAGIDFEFKEAGNGLLLEMLGRLRENPADEAAAQLSSKKDPHAIFMSFEHAFRGKLEDGRFAVVDMLRGEKGGEITIDEAMERIRRRTELMAQEKGRIRGNMVVFGYTVPLQVRVLEIEENEGKVGPILEYLRKNPDAVNEKDGVAPEHIPKMVAAKLEPGFALDWMKTLKWYGVGVKSEAGQLKFTGEKGDIGADEALNRVINGFTAGCILGYHLVVNRRNGTFTNDDPAVLPDGGYMSSLQPQNYLTTSYFADLDLVVLDQKERSETREKFDKALYATLIRDMWKKSSSFFSQAAPEDKPLREALQLQALLGEDAYSNEFIRGFLDEVEKGRRYVDEKTG